jgi:rRNA maturation endonuclease Nob1
MFSAIYSMMNGHKVSECLGIKASVQIAGGEKKMRTTSQLNHTDLKKYFPFIQTCTLCRKQYGVEKKERQKKICPVCAKRLNAV